VPFTPKLLPPLSLGVGDEVYARRRRTSFVSNTEDNFFYNEPVPGIVLGKLSRGRYLVVLTDQKEVVPLYRKQLCVTYSGTPHRLPRA
jgi:hypothetical protein